MSTSSQTEKSKKASLGVLNSLRRKSIQPEVLDPKQETKKPPKRLSIHKLISNFESTYEEDSTTLPRARTASMNRSTSSLFSKKSSKDLEKLSSEDSLCSTTSASPKNLNKLLTLTSGESLVKIEAEDLENLKKEETEDFKRQAKQLLKKMNKDENNQNKSIISEILKRRRNSKKDSRKSTTFDLKKKSIREYDKDDYEKLLKEMEEEIKKQENKMEEERNQNQKAKKEEFIQGMLISKPLVNVEQKPKRYSLAMLGSFVFSRKVEEKKESKIKELLQVKEEEEEEEEEDKETVSIVSDVDQVEIVKSPTTMTVITPVNVGHEMLMKFKTDLISSMEKMFIACYTGDLEGFKILIQENKDINLNKITKNTTLLHAASVNNCSDIIECLIDYGANINVLDSMERTPLHVAVSNGNYESCITLLGRGCKVNERDKYGYSALQLAIKLHKFEIADDIILFKGDINFKRIDGSTILHDCLVHDNVIALKYLLKLNSSTKLIVNPKDSNGDTPLLRAIHTDNLPALKFFTSKKKSEIKFLSQNGIGYNLFHIAARKNSFRSLTFIISLDKTTTTLINQQDQTSRGCSPIHLAIQHGSPEVFQILMYNHCDINVKDNTGNTPLHYAYQKQNAEFITALTKAGAKNLKNNEGITPKRLKKLLEK
jgi:ankyrin repeat protein